MIDSKSSILCAANWEKVTTTFNVSRIIDSTGFCFDHRTILWFEYYFVLYSICHANHLILHFNRQILVFINREVSDYSNISFCGPILWHKRKFKCHAVDHVSAIRKSFTSLQESRLYSCAIDSKCVVKWNDLPRYLYTWRKLNKVKKIWVNQQHLVRRKLVLRHQHHPIDQ